MKNKEKQTNKLRVSVHSTVHKLIFSRIEACSKDPFNELIPIKKINSKLCTSLQIKSSDLVWILILLHDVGLIEFCAWKGVRLNYEVLKDD